MTTLIVILIVLTLGSWLFARRRWYAPAVLFTGAWLVAISAYAILDHGAHPLRPDTLKALTIWLTGFTLATWVMQSFRFNPLLKGITPSVPVRDMYYYFSLATLPVMIWAVVMIIRHTGGNPFSALRDANVRENEQGIRTTGFFVVFWMVSYIMELRVLSKTNLWRVIVLFCINLFYVIISLGKMNMMILFLSTAIILSEKGIIKLKHLFIAVPVLIGLMLSLQLARGSLRSMDNINEFCAIYLGTSIANLNTNVKPHSAEQPGENTFRIYYAVKSKLDGGKTKVVDPILEFKGVQIDKTWYGSNTFTALYPFYKDYGIAGIWVFAIFFGLLFGLIFRLSEDGSICALVLYAAWIGSVPMQIIGDTFFSVLSQNIQYLIAVLIPFIMSKYRVFEPKSSVNG
ncbi:MAG: oligosaccharide repeat unit polymerase [Paludibacteraceae bacterium]|nr:oligosaccharide repeat unit polymerase [Paludibacteraceae bacterium]